MKMRMIAKNFGRIVFIAILITIWVPLSHADVVVSDQAIKDEKHFVVFTGANLSEFTWYAFVGGIYSPFGDIRETGFLVRGFFGFGEYDYDVERSVSDGTPSGKQFTVGIDGDIVAGDLMVGYQLMMNRLALRAFVGGNLKDHDLDPEDDNNPARGAAAGAKFQIELFAPLAQKLWVSAMVSYATTSDDYWSRVRFGYRVAQGWTIGPEGVFTGSAKYGQQRVGGFISSSVTDEITATLSGGYADDRNRGDTAYGGLTLVVQF